MRAFVISSYFYAQFLQVPRLPRAGQSIVATEFSAELGGKGFNLAAALRRLGAKTDLLMAIGRDEFGDRMVQMVREFGMSAKLLHRVEAMSGRGVGFVAPDSDNCLAMYMGANLLLSAAHARMAAPAIRAANWASAQFESPDEPIMEVFAIARQAGVRTYLNPSPWREPAAGLLELVDSLVVNQTEASELFGVSDAVEWPPRAWAEKLLELARARALESRLIVVTLGSEGAIALTPSGDTVYAPAHEIEQVDATGAGDAFGAGLIWSLGRGEDILQALRTGNACGAILARSSGILRNLPDQPTLERFIGEGKG